ncbi:hypothetical protein pipiens_002711 [Culex pipiens pipiens]|uniref:Secreted protein n=1 Tax=Culex pipiens pipiens TaxID=38569 RepID=A0ABD1D9Y2_CULPP
MNWILAVTILASVLPLFTTAAPCCCCCCGGGDEDSSAGSVSGPVDSAGRQRSAFGWLLKAGKFLLGGGAKKGIKGSAKVIKQVIFPCSSRVGVFLESQHLNSIDIVIAHIASVRGCTCVFVCVYDSLCIGIELRVTCFCSP